MTWKIPKIFLYLFLITILPHAGWFLYMIWRAEEVPVGMYVWFFLILGVQLSLSWLISNKVTEKNRELEESNRHLNEIDRLKTEFLANVSHELRTPLTVIMGYSELLTEQLEGIPNEESKYKFIKTIYQKSEDLLSLINDLIELSRVESGRLEMNFKAVIFGNIINEVLEDLSGQAAKKRQVILKVLSESPLVVLADRGKMKQIIRNLVENAIKYTPVGGEIIIRAYSKDKQVCLEVEDNGIGIATEDLEQIYQPFKQIGSSYSKKKYDGFGLGLTITKNLVFCHKGTIQVESTPGEGSKFTLTFPENKIIE